MRIAAGEHYTFLYAYKNAMQERLLHADHDSIKLIVERLMRNLWTDYVTVRKF
jgi:hypothetical protein